MDLLRISPKGIIAMTSLTASGLVVSVDLDLYLVAPIKQH